ncbi:hypothetical protein TNIN_332781 [Trichonephila inaurata madagascariensis]|uniref:Uncharacterized protein n=1 Tax=Trichonephila inaurata madagascariensis TaxID=2747483 RepID=A0A8X6X1X5_9ARAC|nr:hypothetical protein TNIN_332781 [Trichonephila inaurata madagascariensis]
MSGMQGKIGSRLLKRAGSLYCEPLLKNLVSENYGVFSGERYATKFCVKLGKTSKETRDMIKETYTDAAMGRLDVFEVSCSRRLGKSGRPTTPDPFDQQDHPKHVASEEFTEQDQYQNDCDEGIPNPVFEIVTPLQPEPTVFR